jgi:hypothetical protein
MPNSLSSTIEQLQGSGKTFAEFVAIYFNNKFVEIYVGDAYESITTEQVSTTYPAVFCGKVIGAYRECLIIDAAYISKDKKLELGNIMFINERAIRVLNEINGKGILKDMFLASQETIGIKNALDHG